MEEGDVLEEEVKKELGDEEGRGKDYEYVALARVYVGGEDVRYVALRFVV